MDPLHVTVEPERILVKELILRAWSLEDVSMALEIYGNVETSQAIGMRQPVRDAAEMQARINQWALQSSRSPVPQGLWAVEAADDGQLVGGATLLPYSPRDSRLVMSWHLRPAVRGRGLGVLVGHALAHQAFQVGDVEEIFVATAAQNTEVLAVARRLGMSVVREFQWTRRGVPLEVWRMRRADLHRIRPGVSFDNTYDPEGLGDW